MNYDSIASSYKELHKKEQLNKLRIIKNELKLKKSAKVLDVGCGPGFSKILNCKITGLDPSAELLKQAKIKTVRGVAENLPFPDKSFDAVLSVTAIHNFSNIRKALSEMKRVCKGKYAISILRKSARHNYIVSQLEKNFIIEKIINENQDDIFFLKNN